MTVNPQIENGHTDIANEILDYLCSFRIPGECRQVFDTIMRKTWGWHKKEDWIAGTQIVEATKMNKGNVSRSLSKLIKNKLVIKKATKLMINKNYLEWVGFSSVKSYQKSNQLKVIKKATKVIKSDNKKLSKVTDTKEKKETIQKKEVVLVSADSFFSSFKEDNKRVIDKGLKFDVREKDILYCVEQSLEWANGSEVKPNTLIWWESFLSRWIGRSIRRHELSTLSDKEKKEDKKKQVRLSKEEKETLKLLETATIRG